VKRFIFLALLCLLTGCVSNLPNSTNKTNDVPGVGLNRRDNGEAVPEPSYTNEPSIYIGNGARQI
jgi:hypothetical protein